LPIRRKIKAVAPIIQFVTKEEETTASVSIRQIDLIRKEVDLEIESELVGVFAQRRTYGKAADYIAALSDPDVPVKSAWDAAEYSGYETPGPFQSLMGENKWSSSECWDRTAVMAGKAVKRDAGNDPLGTGVIFDETADLKRGKMTCGVGYQYAGCAGGIENCVTWVIASLVGPTVKTWAAAGLFLPEKDWFTGRGDTGTARRRQAGVPGGTRFASKPQIALKQLRRIRALGVEISYGSGDEVYGRYAKLREDHEGNGEAYAYFVPRDHVVTTLGGERRRVDELLELEEAKFEARSAGPGVKGERYYEWAMIGIQSEHHFLILRRPVAEERGGQSSGTCGDSPGGSGEPEAASGEDNSSDRVKEEGITFCLCYVPPQSRIRPTMTNFISMSGRRWGVEETIATGKGPVGWDENQFRKWESLNHHTAITGVAMLRAAMVQQRLDEIGNGVAKAPEPAAEDHDSASEACTQITGGQDAEFSEDDLLVPLGDSRIPTHADQRIPDRIGFIRLSKNEVMRLMTIAGSDMSEAGKAFHLRWSKWRRKHQAISRWYHRIKRMKADQKFRAWPAPAEAVTHGGRDFGWQADAEAKAALPICS
jgi:hypothetical protein